MQAIGTSALESGRCQCSRAREQLLTLAKHVDVPLLPTPTVWPSHCLVDLLPFPFVSSRSLSNAYIHSLHHALFIPLPLSSPPSHDAVSNVPAILESGHTFALITRCTSQTQ